MRRGSLVAPFLLILIGMLFLLNNIRPDLPLLDVAGQYWPLLLVGWGVLRLIEVFFWHVQRKPLPVSGVSGGEWSLVVLIALIGSGLFVANRVSRWPANFGIRGAEVFGDTFDFPVEGELAVTAKTPRILVENLRGNARIVGSDVTVVKVTGRKTVRALRQEDADRANREAPFEITQNGDQIVIRTNQERASGNQRLSADLEISVPRGSSIEGRGRYGDFDITDVLGKVDINSDNAGVRIQNIGGDLRVDLRRSDIVRASGVKGSVDVKASKGQDVDLDNIAGPVNVEGTYTGEVQFRNLAKPLKYQTEHTELHVEKVPGELRLALGDLTGNNITGPVRLSANRSRDVELSNYTDSVDITLERGDVVLRPAKNSLGKVEVKTRSGDIELALPSNAKFEISAKTDHGSVQNEFGGPLNAENNDRSGSMIGKVGVGPMLRLNTDRGEVRIRKSEGEEMAEAPLSPPNAPVPPAAKAPRRPPTEMQ
jgi:DUF4097 and DUF4098 domain-containing protein YvlB